MFPYVAFASPHITFEAWKRGQASDIEIFEDQLQGFVFDQVTVLIRADPATSQHASDALLALLSPYFEMITCYVEGREPKGGESTEFLRRGLATVLGAVATPEAVKAYVQEIRNGVAHELMFRTIVLHRDAPTLPSFGLVRGVLAVDAFWLADAVHAHFRDYVARLRSPAMEGDHVAIANFARFMEVRKRRAGLR